MWKLRCSVSRWHWAVRHICRTAINCSCSKERTFCFISQLISDLSRNFISIQFTLSTTEYISLHLPVCLSTRAKLSPIVRRDNFLHLDPNLRRQYRFIFVKMAPYPVCRLRQLLLPKKRAEKNLRIVLHCF